MSFHARPIPAPARMPGGRTAPAPAEARFTSPLDDPPATLATPSSPTAEGATPASVVEHVVEHVVEDVVATPPRAPSSGSRQEAFTSTAAGDMPRPWYRREPWAAVAMTAFVPIVVGFVTPQTFHVLLLGVSALLVTLSIAMLVRRQGPYREHPRRR